VAANLIDLAKGYLTTEVVHRISSALGENPERVETAIEAGIPSILAGFLKMASSGGNRLFEMLKHEPSELSHLGGLDGAFGNLGSLLSGGSIDSVIKYGQSVLSSLFGGKLNSIVDLIVRSSGIKAGSATSLLGMLAPLVMGMLRKETASRGSTPASLTNLLMEQKDAIAKVAPAGLSNALGLGSLSDLSSAADSIRIAGGGAAREVGRTAAAAANRGSEWLRWAAPLALLAALLLGLYFWSNSQVGPQPNPAQPPDLAQATRPVTDAARQATERATQGVTDAARQATERATQGVSDAGKRLTEDGKALIETVSRKVSLSLPGNVKIDVPENSYLQAMVRSFNEGAGTGEAKSFVADNLDFEGDTPKLAPDSSTAITNLATIMRAFGTAKLKIVGHADGVGDPAQNKQIALDRANAVKDALVKAGVPVDRVIAEGAGPDRPIASNDTEGGRAKNRRIELTIVSR
jgi:outer membrane protein OmpA-like peptidoglycan-associated protein